MTVTAEERILHMLQQGKLSATQAEQLLKALQATPRRLLRTLIDPLAMLSTRTALTLATLGAAAQVALSLLLPLRFDGALDVHRSLNAASLETALLDLLAGWPLPVLLFYLAGKLTARRTRLVDIGAAVGLSRLPLLVVAAAALAMPKPPSTVAGFQPSLVVIALAVALLPVIAYVLVLLFRGFRTATGLAGGRLWLTFLLALTVAEIASKLLVSL